jgi:hypothetical protein
MNKKESKKYDWKIHKIPTLKKLREQKQDLFTDGIAKGLVAPQLESLQPIKWSLFSNKIH